MDFLRKNETHAALGAVGGMLIGISQNNYGLGIALAVVLGASVYVVGNKKKKGEAEKEESAKTDETL